MRVRLRPLALLAFLTITFILDTFNGLSGFLSALLSVLVPSVFLISLIQLIYSLFSFTFHQNFSNDHPLKGEIVRYELHTANESLLPMAQGTCSFSAPDPLHSFKNPITISTARKASSVYTEEIHCAYRGTYIIGLSGYTFREALGIFEIEERIEPRVFHVYPELVKLKENIEKLTDSSGADMMGTKAQEDDIAIFEYVRPIREGRVAHRIAWKRWAATGIPVEIIHGQSRTAALRIVLDLWPLDISETPEAELEKLAAEDIAISAVFSILQYLVNQAIPVSLILGGDEKSVLVDSQESFQRLYDQSTSIIFSDERFPASAFSPGPSTLLVSTRPLVVAEALKGKKKFDLFTAYEEALTRRGEPHLLICPPSRTCDREKELLDALIDRQGELVGKALLRLADSRLGTEDIIHALCT